MLEPLVEEPAMLGLIFNAKKKDLAAESLGSPCFMDVNGGMVEILHSKEQHKYLGKNNAK